MRYARTNPRCLANAVQAEALSIILPLTLPKRRVPVGAAYLGYTVAQVLDAAGASSRVRSYYRDRLSDSAAFPVWLAVNLPKVFGVPFWIVWDDEALESPQGLFAVALEKPRRDTQLRAV